MKKQIALATTAAALLSTGAYASKARMQALGQDLNQGSYFLNDTRNVFRNAAGVASMNNYMIVETGQTRDANASDTTPNAEGGIFRNAGSFTYGLYFGNNVGSQDTVREGTAYAGTGVTIGSTSLVDRANELDLFFGGDMGVEWGARLSYASSKNKGTTSGNPEAKQSSFGLGLGMNMGDLGAWLNLGLSDKSENLIGSATAGAKWEADTAINVGVSYGWNNWTFYGEYDTKGAKYTASSGTAKNETSRDTITVGAGHTHEVSSTSVVVTEIKYVNQKSEDKDGTTSTNGGKLTTSTLPVAFAFETDANSWLTLRAGLVQNIILNSTTTKLNTSGSVEGKTTDTDTIDVNTGATLNFGKLKVDGMVGTSTNGSLVTTSAENGSLALDNLMSRVAVHYWF